MIDHSQFVSPVTTRSRLMLEVASELVGSGRFSPEGIDWVERQTKILFRAQGEDDWPVTFFASDNPQGIEEVAAGRATMAIMNPAEPLTLAYRGTGPFDKPLPLRVITVIPSEDQMAFAVTEKSGLTCLEDIAERRFPLRVSLRRQPHHSCHFFARHVLEAAGVSLEDIVAWGGEVRSDLETTDIPARLGAVRRGEIDAIFDEAVNRWVNQAAGLGMRVLPFREPLLARLESMGFRRGVIPKTAYPNLPSDVVSLDFSGWSVFTHAEASDKIVTAFCAALEIRKDRIPWQGEGPLPLERMCKDGQDTPLDVPLHPAAERFWRSRGYL